MSESIIAVSSVQGEPRVDSRVVAEPHGANPVHRAARDFIAALGFCIAFAALLSLANATSSNEFWHILPLLMVGILLLRVGA